MQRKAVSQTDDFVDKNRLKRHLSSDDHRRILDACGFDLQGERGTDLDEILGPKELGEGETGNFSVDLDDGLVYDHGSTGYEGNVFQIVQDVHGLDFNEALEWIVEELNLDRSRLTSEPPASSSSSTSTSNGRAHNGHANSSPNGTPSNTDSNSPDSEPDPEPEPVASHEQVQKWSERLLGDSSEAQAARGYLTNGRGLTERALKVARIGLAHTPSDNRATWWIMIPVPDRRVEGAPIVATKGFGFDPSGGDWERNDNGHKVARNGGSAALYNLVFPDALDTPVLVCEGELDALSALSHGFNAVTGTAGAGTFEPEWGERISSLAPAQDHGVVVAFDGDEAGRNNGPDVAATLAQEDLDVRLANLPDGQDVNDVLVNRGREGLEVVIDTSISLTSANRGIKLQKLKVANRKSPDSPPESAEKTGETGEDHSSGETRLDWEDFPLSTLPDSMRGYVTAQAEAMCVDPSMIAVPGLCALAAAVGNSRHVELKSNWSEPPTLWSMLIAPSGTLKSQSLEKALAPIFRKEQQLKKEHDRELDAWQERDEEERDARPQRERRLVNDATVESVALLHDDHPRGLLLYRDELAGWLGSFNQYNKGESDLQKWIEFYESRPIEVDRKSSDRPSIFIEHPSISITGSIQPQVLDDRLNSLHFQTGFAARAIMYEPPERKRRWNDHNVTDRVRQRYLDLVGRLYGLQMPDRSGMGTSADLPLDRVAQDIFAEFYNDSQEIIEELQSGPLRSLVAKNQAVAARLALTLQLCEAPQSEEVGRDAMIAGTRLARWLRRETARVYQRHGFTERGVSKDRRLARQLPDGTFGVDAISQVWECQQRTAYNVRDRLIEQGLVEKVGHGEYRSLITAGEADPYSQLD
jgi:DNA primase